MIIILELNEYNRYLMKWKSAVFFGMHLILSFFHLRWLHYHSVKTNLINETVGVGKLHFIFFENEQNTLKIFMNILFILFIWIVLSYLLYWDFFYYAKINITKIFCNVKNILGITIIIINCHGNCNKYHKTNYQ